MQRQGLQRKRDERTRSPDARRELGLCLRQAFAVGDAGSFTTLLQAIGDATEDARP